MILDIGANADVRPEHIQQFAIMGTIYARDVIGIDARPCASSATVRRRARATNW
jgi:fatty acid/phospholipid biosynthesis enzyme